MERAAELFPRLDKVHAWWLAAMGRLKPGWTPERATAHMAAVAPGIMQATLPPDYRVDNAKKYLANKLAVLPAASGVPSPELSIA